MRKSTVQTRVNKKFVFVKNEKNQTQSPVFLVCNKTTNKKTQKKEKKANKQTKNKKREESKQTNKKQKIAKKTRRETTPLDTKHQREKKRHASSY